MSVYKNAYAYGDASVYNALNIYDVSKFIAISAPTLSNNYPLVLPAVQGQSAEALTNDGSGNLSFEIQESYMNQSGFYEWYDTGNYWSITSSTTFNLLRGGKGYIRNKPIIFAKNQSVTLITGARNFIYIDLNGLVQRGTSRSNVFFNGIVLFEVLHDGTNYTVKRENHPVSFSMPVSEFFHDNMGCTIRGSGAILTASATVGKVKIVGNDVLEDHGIYTDIIATDPIIIECYYTNTSARWIQYSNSSTIPPFYNLNGVPTAITTNSYSVYRIYTILDNLNTTMPIYIAVMNVAEYKKSTDAIAAINTGAVPGATDELKQLEPCQLGYIIIQNVGGAVIVNSIIVQKNTINARYEGSNKSSSSHLMLSDNNSGQYSCGGHLNCAQRYLSPNYDPLPTDDDSFFLTSCVWIREDNYNAFICVDNSQNSAVWQQTKKKLKTITNISSELDLTNAHHILLCSTTTTSYNINLPSLDLYPGIDYIFSFLSKTSTYTITVLAYAADKIDGTLSQIILQNAGDRLKLTNCGTGWFSFV